MKHRLLSKRYWNDLSTALGKSEAARNGHTYYTDCFGDIELRKEISRLN